MAKQEEEENELERLEGTFKEREEKKVKEKKGGGRKKRYESRVIGRGGLAGRVNSGEGGGGRVDVGLVVEGWRVGGGGGRGERGGGRRGRRGRSIGMRIWKGEDLRRRSRVEMNMQVTGFSCCSSSTSSSSSTPSSFAPLLLLLLLLFVIFILILFLFLILILFLLLLLLLLLHIPLLTILLLFSNEVGRRSGLLQRKLGFCVRNVHGPCEGGRGEGNSNFSSFVLFPFSFLTIFLIARERRGFGGGNETLRFHL